MRIRDGAWPNPIRAHFWLAVNTWSQPIFDLGQNLTQTKDFIASDEDVWTKDLFWDPSQLRKESGMICLLAEVESFYTNRAKLGKYSFEEGIAIVWNQLLSGGPLGIVVI